MTTYKQQKFLIVLLVEKSKVKVQADLVSDESWPPGSQMAIFSLCPHMVEGAEYLYGVSFIKALISFMRPLSSCPNHIL